jgi:hypothetical protein
MPPLPNNHFRWWHIACLVLAFISIQFSTSPQQQPIPGRDAGVYLYMGWRITEGDLPYRDVWDHKPPLLFCFNALGLRFGAGSRWGVWALQALMLGISLILSVRLLGRYFSSTLSTVATLLWMFWFMLTMLGGNLAGDYALPFQFACLTLAPALLGHSLPRPALVLLGALIGCLFWIKQTTIGIPLATMFCFSLPGLYQQPRRVIPALGLIGSGVLLISGAILAPFWLRGSFAALIDATITYNRFYVTNHSFSGALWIYPLLNLVLLIVVTGIAILARRRSRRAAQGWQALEPGAWALATIGVIDVPIEILAISLPGRYYPHYYSVMAPGLAMSAALGLLLLRSVAQGAAPGTVRLLKPISTLGLCVVIAAGAYLTSQRQTRRSRLALTDYLTSHSGPDDPVLLWGGETVYNFLSARASPTRFVYQYPLYEPGYATTGMHQEFLDDLTRRPPRLIVDTNEPTMLFLHLPLAPPAMQRRLDSVRAAYRQVAVVDGWTVYARVAMLADP